MNQLRGAQELGRGWRFVVLAALLGIFNILAWQSKQTPQIDTELMFASNSESSVEEMADSNTIAVSVGEVSFSHSEVWALVAKRSKAFRYRNQFVPPVVIQQHKETLRQTIIEELVVGELLAREIRRARFEVTEEDFQQSLREHSLTLEALEKEAASLGRSYEDMLAELRLRILHERFMKETVDPTIIVTDMEIEKFYQKNLERRFISDETWRFRHIQINSLDMDPNEGFLVAKRKAMQTAHHLVDLVRSGADFAELARQYSHSQTAAKGGDLGYQYQQTLTDLLGRNPKSLKLDSKLLSNAIEHQNSYHIVQLIDHKKHKVTPLAQAKPDIVNLLQQKKRPQAYREYLASLRVYGNIKYGRY